MICKNCGAEFNEGIFCPECGIRNDEVISVEKTIVEGAQSDSDGEPAEMIARVEAEKQIEIERQKTEQAKFEAEKTAKEAELLKLKLEQERIEAEKIAAEEKKKKADEEARQKEEQLRLAEEKKLREEAEKERRLVEKKELAQKRAIENEGKGPAIVSLILGIVSIVTGGMFIIPAVIGLIVSNRGKKQGKKLSIAKAGFILSIISLVLGVGIYAFIIIYSEVDNKKTVAEIAVIESYIESGSYSDAEDYITNSSLTTMNKINCYYDLYVAEEEYDSAVKVIIDNWKSNNYSNASQSSRKKIDAIYDKLTEDGKLMVDEAYAAIDGTN